MFCQRRGIEAEVCKELVNNLYATVCIGDFTIKCVDRRPDWISVIQNQTELFESNKVDIMLGKYMFELAPDCMSLKLSSVVDLVLPRILGDHQADQGA